MKGTGLLEYSQLSFDHIANMEESILIINNAHDALATTIQSFVSNNIFLEPEVVDILMDELMIMKCEIERITESAYLHNYITNK